MKAIKDGAIYGLRAARAGWFPTLSLNCSNYYSERTAFGSSRDKYDGYWISYLSVDLPVFDGFLTKSKVDQSQARIEELKILEKELEETIKLEVENTYFAVQAAREVVESQIKNVARAEEGYEIMKTRYDHGKAAQLDLLDAQLALSTAKLNHAQSLFAHIISKAALKKAIGED